MKKVVLCIFIMFSVLKTLQAKTEVISFDPGIKDYVAVFNKIINSFLAGNDSNLKIIIQTGKYPMLTGAAYKYSGAQKKTIEIEGRASNNKIPVLYTPQSVSGPEPFWAFLGNIDKPINFQIKISNLSFLGNNVPYSANHPFFGNKASPQTCLNFSNVLTFSVINCTIENFYGNGIVAGNGYSNNDDKKFSIQSPLIQKVVIKNSWSENHQANSGIGICIGYAIKPRILNCTISNNLMYSRYYGFVGIDLEGRTDQAIINNNVVEGYHTLIHDECTYGGHSITNNILRESEIGVNISEDCNQNIQKKYLYSSIKIDKNTFEYSDEYSKVGLPRADWGFISVYKPRFVTEGLQITNNKFKVKIGDAKSKSPIKKTSDWVTSDKKNYILLRGQQKVLISNNTYE